MCFAQAQIGGKLLRQLQKLDLEKMLEDEPDSHLDCDKNQRFNSGNTRIGYSIKKVRSSCDEDSIKVLRDRNVS